MSQLFSPLRMRSVEFRNRVFVSPMCQYSSHDGLATPWHLVHLGSRAVGGAGLVMVEATSVSREGRISPGDSGIWSDAHVEALAPIAAFIREQGAIPAIQLAHAGRKASTDAPWRGARAIAPADGGWQPLAPSAIPLSAHHPTPRAMSADDLRTLVEQFTSAARRAREAGFDVVELHYAHGYLVHEFLSPISNQRDDEYGGDLDNRMRLALDLTRAVRAAWPADLPLWVRISASDWVDGGWDVEQSVTLASRLKALGVDLIDCSSGGLVPDAPIAVGPGYQVPFAAEIRRRSGVATGAVGMITEAEQAEHIIANGEADVVFLARELLRDPYWPLHAAHQLGVDAPWPPQYERAKPR